jgi:phosphohistidine swiveling domain-containing protein
MVTITIANTEKREFVKHWAGKWSLLSSSYFGQYYTKDVKSVAKNSVKVAIITSKSQYSICYFDKDEIADFGNSLAAAAKKDSQLILAWCSDLKIETDSIMSLMKQLSKKQVTKTDFSKFTKALKSYSCVHMCVKKIVDYLPEDLLKELLPELESARLYSEPVYSETEIFTEIVADQIAKKNQYSRAQILCLTQHEIDDYFTTSLLPFKNILDKRDELSALVFIDGKYSVVSGDEAKEYEQIVTKVSDTGMLKGKTAFKGHVTGTVRIILEPNKKNTFNKGDILVTGMTRPEYMPYIAKASAVITDAGGILCHAAITAREMKIPTIVGTEKATKVLNDGDKVEVDATNGTVNKI